MASLAPHRNSSIALRYIEATIGLFDDRGLMTRLAHPSLQFRKIGKVWSARVGSSYRTPEQSHELTFC